MVAERHVVDRHAIWTRLRLRGVLRTVAAASVFTTVAACGGAPPADTPTPGAAPEEMHVDEAATTLLDSERFTFAVEWEGSGFGTEEVLTAQGGVDLASDLAVYEPLIDVTGDSEVRILGEDSTSGVGGAGSDPGGPRVSRRGWS